MAITFQKLRDLMASREINKHYLRKCGISPAIVDKMFCDGIVSTVTINKVCKYLECKPGDIMDYIPDKN